MKKAFTLILLAMLVFAAGSVVADEWPDDTNKWPIVRGTTLGKAAFALNTNGVAIGGENELAWTGVDATGAVQIGAGSNTVANSFNYRSVVVVDADGNVGDDDTLYTSITGEVARATAAEGVNYTAITGEVARAVAAEAVISVVTTNAGIVKIVAGKTVLSGTANHLQVEATWATNNETLVWTTAFSGTPYVVASYAHQAVQTNILGSYAAAQCTTVSSTNCVVIGDGVVGTSHIDVIAIGTAL